MSGYDLFKELSALDEALLTKPYRLVSVRLNLLLCIIAANISAVIPDEKPVLSIVVFLAAFGLMYYLALRIINRRTKNKLITETRSEP